MAHHRVPVASGRPQHTRGREGPCTCARQRVRPTAWPPDDLTPVDGEISPQPSEWVIEFDRPTRKSKDGAKSDALDAVRAAREMLGRKRLSIPRAHDGAREAIRVHAVTRAAAVRARTAAINELKAIIVTADESLRAQVPRAAHRWPGRRLCEVPRSALQRRRRAGHAQLDAVTCSPGPAARHRDR